MPAKESPQDILLVRNVDTDCNEVSSELIRKDRTQQDDNGHNYIAFEEVEEDFNHADFFQVKYDGVPFRIAPGGFKRMPRYLAEHYAKHLANHILQKKEAAEEKVGLVNNVRERPRVLKTIIEGVEEYYYDDDNNLEGGVGIAARREMEAADERISRKKGTDLGAIEDRDPVPNTALGKLTDDAPESLEDVLKRTDLSEDENVVAAPPPAGKSRLDDLEHVTKRELVEAAVSQGIKLSGRENKADLAAKIKQSA